MLLYIHIPFCDSKCSYCSFNSYVDKFHLKQEYMNALQLQLEHEIQRFEVKKNSIESIFIGGGTPSTVPAELYENLFVTLKPYAQKDIEITSEANPNSASKEWLEGMYQLGVNRISFGVQSFHQEKLKILNRAHSPEDAQNAIISAREIGFKNLSLDIIYATLGDTKELLQEDLLRAFSLPINHISAYALTIEQGTAFEKKPFMSHETLELTSWLFQKIQEKNFEQYEISNFGSYKSIHNLGYWRYKDYIGLGSGAVGKIGLQRLYPQKNIDLYINNPLDIDIEFLTEEEKKMEQIFLGFRSIVGVHEMLFNEAEINRAQLLVKERKLLLKNKVFYNPNYLLADEITLFISS